MLIKWKHKINARALYLVIFISFISSVILLFFISSNYYTQIETLNYQNLKGLVDANNSLLQFSLDAKDNSPINLADIPSFDSVDIQARLENENWGAFLIAKSTARWKNISYTKAALIGHQLFAKEKIGLYLADYGKYLSVAGNTKLSGVCYLPALGIRSVYIDGKPYRGSKLIYGEEKTSKSELPPINENLIRLIKTAFGSEFTDSIGDIEDLNRKKGVSNSFLNKTVLYTNSDEIILKNIELTGRIIVQSESSVVVDKSTKTSGIIIFAPNIIIESGFKGSLQAFASDSLLIEEDVELQYPSTLAVYNLAGSSAFCYISNGAYISGGVLCSAALSLDKGVSLIIEPDAIVNGLVYCKGSVNLKGSIFGSLYTNRFKLQTPRAYYENHLFNAVIDPMSQYQGFSSPIFFNIIGNRAIAEWLN